MRPCAGLPPGSGVTNITDGTGAGAKPTRPGDRALPKSSLPGMYCPAINPPLRPARRCRGPPRSHEASTGRAVPHPTRHRTAAAAQRSKAPGRASFSGSLPARADRQGRREVEGPGAGKDFKLYPRAAAAPGTGRNPGPGIGLVSSPPTSKSWWPGAAAIVPSPGHGQATACSPGYPRLPATAWRHGACRPHPRGAKIYTQLAERGLVAGLFHSTCWHPPPSARPPGHRAAC